MDKRYVKVVVTGKPVNVGNSVKTFGTHGPMWLDVKDIFVCLANGAAVYDVSSKKEVRLNFTNYSDINTDEESVLQQKQSTPTQKTGNFRPTTDPVLRESDIKDPSLPVFTENPPAMLTNDESVTKQDESDIDDSNDGEPVQYRHNNKKGKRH